MAYTTRSVAVFGVVNVVEVEIGVGSFCRQILVRGLGIVHGVIDPIAVEVAQALAVGVPVRPKLGCVINDCGVGELSAKFLQHGGVFCLELFQSTRLHKTLPGLEPGGCIRLTGLLEQVAQEWHLVGHAIHYALEVRQAKTHQLATAGSPQLHIEILAHVLHHLVQDAFNVRVFLDVGDQQIVCATLDQGQFVGGGPNPLFKGGIDLILNARLRQFGEQAGQSHCLPIWACDGEDVLEAGGAAGGPTDGKRWRP